jgi:hypothetical protein
MSVTLLHVMAEPLPSTLIWCGRRGPIEINSELGTNLACKRRTEDWRADGSARAIAVLIRCWLKRIGDMI